MRANVEVYKGIEFVRISHLPKEQQVLIYQTDLSNKTIKILQGDTVISDCLQYRDYQEWYERYHITKINAAVSKQVNNIIAIHQPADKS